MSQSTRRPPEDASAEAVQYALRSSFYYRQASEFAKLAEKAKRVARSTKCEWPVPGEFGISQAAWEGLAKRRITPELVFCHPAILARAPDLAEHYRSVAALPQKGLARLLRQAVAPRGGKDADSAIILCRVVNSHLSGVIEAEPAFSLQLALQAAYMNYGAQTNGSWRNRIGSEGAATVAELIVNYFVEPRLVTSFRLKDGAQVRTLSGAITEVQRFDVINGYSVTFGSEPDISIRNQEGVLEVAIEVKAGLDPAGALERYGACKKSFDRALDRDYAYRAGHAHPTGDVTPEHWAGPLSGLLKSLP